MQLAIFPDDLGGIVARSVVHNQDFDVPVLSLGIAEKFIERRPDTYAFVVGGNDDTVGQKSLAYV